MSKKVLILGGTGFLGYYVLRALDKEGLDVAVLLHKKKDDQNIPFEGYEIFEGDILKPDTLKTAIDKFNPDVVVDMVGSLTKKSSQTPKSLMKEGTQNVVTASKDGGVKKIIYISELGTATTNKNLYFRARKSAEDVIKNSSLEWTIFRPSTMFGWRGGLTGGIVRQIESAPPVPVVKKQVRPLYAGVLAGAIEETVSKDKGKNTMYEVGGPEALEYSQIVNRLKLRANSERREVRVPKYAVKLFGLGMNKAQKHVIFNSYHEGNFTEFSRDFPDIAQVAFDAAGDKQLY